jgi:hypothetical protein
MCLPLRRTLVVILMASLLTGCTGYKQIPLDATPPGPDAVVKSLRVGDSVRVKLRDGSTQKFAIAAVEAGALVGKGGERLPFADIAEVERRQVSPGKTLGLVIAIAGGFFVLMIIGLYSMGPVGEI